MHSVDAIYLATNNLPRSQRFKPENGNVFGVIPGPHEHMGYVWQKKMVVGMRAFNSLVTASMRLDKHTSDGSFLYQLSYQDMSWTGTIYFVIFL
ncbi:uncharacterized protein BYT42DRAFT_584041 [Radiomyces spectabilis]|uniref:uncharacterized protein n=1 Tax=Radiomyces spectabilis TaxID=64574 RepID=UPI00221E96A9|nr:uncharacterized protein BYT42DRAFT_584041 [Radiomyces spectabilis]KAI8369343.1 hypothetical protein BYT42DRAFT_584041 [Radiomyces spectabilis]